MVENSLIAETRYGSMDIMKDDGDIVSRFLLRYGEWSELEVQFVSANILDYARIADIGAFVGSFGIGLSQSKDIREVLFIEANAEVVPLLRRNVERNCRARHEVLDALLFPEGQKATTVKRHGANQGSISYDPDSDAEIALDAVLPEHSIGLGSLLKERGPFDLLKLDIEGLELDVLRDIEAELAGGSISIWAECNETSASLQLADFLLSCGLRVHYFAFPSFNPNNFRGEKEAIFPMAYEAGLYASRSAPVFPDGLRQAGCLCHEINDGEDLRKALWRTPRWCPPELLSSQLEETLAVAIRHLSGDRYATFLASTVEVADYTNERRIASPLALVQALERTENQLRVLIGECDVLKSEGDTHARIVDQLNAQIGLEREQALQHARLAEWVQALAQDRLKLLQAERKRRFAPSRRIQDIIASRYRRAVKVLLRSIASRPYLYRAAQTVGVRFRRIARYLHMDK